MNASGKSIGGLRTVSIVGTGSYLPSRILTNHDLAGMVDTSDEWIVTRTGMKERRLAAESEATSDLGAEAARRALMNAGIRADEVDLLIAATITPDYPFPNTGCMIQSKIGATQAACMGLEAACSGFVYGLDIARQYIACGSAQTVLVVGAEKMSSILDWQDRSTCVLFGDGAGAAVLRAVGAPKGILTTVLGSDGTLSDLLQVPAGGSRLPASAETVAARLHTLKMNGREVYKHAVTNMTRAARTALVRAGLDVGDIRWVIPHQANRRILAAISDRMKIPMDRFVINVEKYGNTSGASVGIALDEAACDGRLKKGDLVMMLVFGGGFTWGAMIMEWWK
ncbi:MAG: beta-ketoacyl-ACP synthase III [Kiritimatiellia bacterium]|nr:beta-ketoacyl-ACP synthase III [Kiritimatiellia bacterium]